MSWRCDMCRERFEPDDGAPAVCHPKATCHPDPDAGTRLVLCEECESVISAARDGGLTPELLERYQEYQDAARAEMSFLTRYHAERAAEKAEVPT